MNITKEIEIEISTNDLLDLVRLSDYSTLKRIKDIVFDEDEDCDCDECDECDDCSEYAEQEVFNSHSLYDDLKIDILKKAYKKYDLEELKSRLDL